MDGGSSITFLTRYSIVEKLCEELNLQGMTGIPELPGKKWFSFGDVVPERIEAFNRVLAVLVTQPEHPDVRRFLCLERLEKTPHRVPPREEEDAV